MALVAGCSPSSASEVVAVRPRRRPRPTRRLGLREGMLTPTVVGVVHLLRRRPHLPPRAGRRRASQIRTDTDKKVVGGRSDAAATVAARF